jgi:hypothetical protein
VIVTFTGYVILCARQRTPRVTPARIPPETVGSTIRQPPPGGRRRGPDHLGWDKIEATYPWAGDLNVADPESRVHCVVVSPATPHRPARALSGGISVRQWISSLPWAFLFLILCAPDAGASALKIRPDQFQPVTPGHSYGVTPAFAQGPIALWATLTLPAGKTIKKLAFYADVLADGGGTLIVDLYRVKMGASEEKLAEAGANLDGPTGIEVVSSTDIDSPVVAAGYTYYLTVLLPDYPVMFRGVQLTYQ